MSGRVVVVAHKFNDIYYAINSSEFLSSEERILIVVEKGLMNSNNFPFKEKFDKCVSIKKQWGHLSLLLLVILFVKIGVVKRYQSIFFSNPVLLINQILYLFFLKPSVLLIEDGLMNYIDFQESRSFLKRIGQFVSGISTKRVCRKIITTYLTEPEKATYFFGQRKKIDVKSCYITSDICNRLEGARIFVGGNYYDYRYMTLMEYNKLVNYLIRKNHIDFYLPHPFASLEEKIDCEKIDLNSLSLTLEMLATNCSFSIFSIGASSSFICKNLNSKVKTYFFVYGRFSEMVSILLKENSDYVFFVNENLELTKENV